MNPVSTLLFLLGYGLALPIAARPGSVFTDRRRMAIRGYQFGVLLAALGWLVRGRVLMMLLHVGWIVAIRLWFELRTGDRRSRPPDSSP